jgi:hypothetical protein
MSTTDLEATMAGLEEDPSRRNRFSGVAGNDYTIHLLPPIRRGTFYYEYGMHYGLDALGMTERPYATCLRLTLRQDCPICERQQEAWEESRRKDGSIDPDQQQFAAGFRAVRRYACNMIQQGHEEVQIWYWGKKTKDQLAPLFRRFGDLTSAEHGKWLSLAYGKTGGFTTVTSISVLPQDYDLPNNWEKGLHDLEAIVAKGIVSQDELRKRLGGVSYPHPEDVASVGVPHMSSPPSGDPDTAPADATPPSALEEVLGTIDLTEPGILKSLEESIRRAKKAKKT